MLNNTGAWGLSPEPDPFINQYPVITYLPYGTVIFSKGEAPEKLKRYGYISIETQYGYKVLIKERDKGGNLIYTKFDNIILKPPSNYIIMNLPIFCPWQENFLAIGSVECEDDGVNKRPIGKGWVYQFRESDKGDKWRELYLNLDLKTSDELKSLGLTIKQVKFDIKFKKLESLEDSGHITILNKEIPRFTIFYKTKPLILPCGAKEISVKEIKESYKLGIDGEASIKTPDGIGKFFEIIKLSLGLSGSYETNKNSTKSLEITVDTTNSSYLFRVATIKDTKTNIERDIRITKHFNCEENNYGEKITKVKFLIDDGHDYIPYEFHEPSKIFKSYNQVVAQKYMPRPYFISYNSPEQYTNALSQLIDDTKTLDIYLAHFILSNLNYTCKSNFRCYCEKISNNESTKHCKKNN
ncbi:hypothetical protein [Photobacterium alginatilyticum]|uniref:Uncharacterized protein n=1 Tax=Photobacterium alginatilyticum TaxID=1775171 RepID=A0ABW9YLG2_9GAMM|nr:hypothetical protein [Photobacterium alginatilyticum]NBI54638.1 hypothetical protein [Photobacterium alginatilyticum]